MKSDQRAKLIDRAIRLTWTSLESHLEWTHRASSEGKRFHRQCIAEYAETISILSKLL